MSLEILVTGGAGRLARALKRTGGDRIGALGRADLDVTDQEAVEAAVGRIKPLAVINTAAISSVEASERNPDAAVAVNALAPGLIARICARQAVPLIHISTDYLFGGDGLTRPYREDDAPSPVNAYGRMKAEGERRALAEGGSVCVTRVAWLFGDGEDFISSLLRGDPARPVQIADDQVGAPTPIYLLADRLIALAVRMAAAEPGLPSVLNLAGTPPAVRADWVAAAFDAVRRAGGTPPPMVRVPMSALAPVVERPRYSALDGSLSATLCGHALEWKPAIAAAFG